MMEGELTDIERHRAINLLERLRLAIWSRKIWNNELNLGSLTQEETQKFDEKTRLLCSRYQRLKKKVGI